MCLAVPQGIAGDGMDCYKVTLHVPVGSPGPNTNS